MATSPPDLPPRAVQLRCALNQHRPVDGVAIGHDFFDERHGNGRRQFDAAKRVGTFVIHAGVAYGRRRSKGRAA
jgi:hypothetical protein